MEKGYKFRLYPTPEQAEFFQQNFGCCRFVYNYYLAKRIEVYKNNGETLGFNDCCKDLTQLKKELTWLYDADSKALQLALGDLDKAYQGFFRRAKQGVVPGYPRFKSKRNHHKSYKSNAPIIKLVENAVLLPKIGLVECRVSRPLEGRIISATVSQTPGGKYYVSLCCSDIEPEPLPETGAVVGIHCGITYFSVTSDGVHIENPKYLLESQKKIARLQRRLSRKSKDSANWEKARIKLARAHEKIADQRNDMLHKVSTYLVRDYDVICVQDLHVEKIVKNRKLLNSISDASWSEFRRRLEYKSKWYGKQFVCVEQYFPSNQLCGSCGYKNADVKSGSKKRKWICPKCGVSHDRRINAASNILNEGLRLLA